MNGKKAEIINWLEEYRRRTNCKGVVVGISGGKDSTTVAMLAKTVWGDNMLGVLMPNGVQPDLDDSLEIVRTLGIKYKVVNIGEIYDAFLRQTEGVSDRAKTNIPPRLRMTVLYALAQTLDYRVIGTGNASERYIGWFTKWGDGAYDFDPIASLTCTEVVQLGTELCRDFGLDAKYIVKTPADGLTGRSDEENFGFSYDDLDKLIRRGRDAVKLEIADKIEGLHRASEHKRRVSETFGE